MCSYAFTNHINKYMFKFCHVCKLYTKCHDHACVKSKRFARRSNHSPHILSRDRDRLPRAHRSDSLPRSNLNVIQLRSSLLGRSDHPQAITDNASMIKSSHSRATGVPYPYPHKACFAQVGHICISFQFSQCHWFTY